MQGNVCLEGERGLGWGEEFQYLYLFKQNKTLEQVLKEKI